MQDESNIQRAFCGLGRLRAIQHQQEICSMGERTVWLNHALAFSQAIVRRNNHRNLRSQADGFADVGGVIVALLVAIVQTKGGDGRA